MTKKVLLILAILVAVINVGIVVYFSQRKTEPLDSQGEEIAEPVMNTKNWEDPAGFSFVYPQEAAINAHPEDEENYAHLELTASAHPGSIIIFVKETKYRDIDLWAKDNSAQASVLDTQLAGRVAKKIAYNLPKKLLVAAIDVDSLVTIEMGLSEQDYWQKVFEQILTSFKFVPIAGEPTSAPAAKQTQPSAGQSIIDEGEEIIE